MLYFMVVVFFFKDFLGGVRFGMVWELGFLLFVGIGFQYPQYYVCMYLCTCIVFICMMNLLPAILLISGLLEALFFGMGLFALVSRIGCAFHSGL